MMRNGLATGLSSDGFPKCEAFPNPDAGNCICPFNKNRECYDAWFDEYYFQNYPEERDEMSTPEMIDCPEHGSHALKSCLKIGSRYYCPLLDGDGRSHYLGAERPQRILYPRTWWRDQDGFYERRPQPPLPVWLRGPVEAVSS